MSKLNSIFVLCSALLFCSGCSTDAPSKKDLTTYFDKGYGQLEIGGKYCGLEFHHSKPLPTRINFYYPVANSIDLAEGYWTRDLSQPLFITLKEKTKIDTIGLKSLPYSFTPYQAQFLNKSMFRSISYDVGEDMSLLVIRIKLKNLEKENRNLQMQIRLNTLLRSSHTYDRFYPTGIKQQDEYSILAFYRQLETDSVCLFLSSPNDPKATFSYSENNWINGDLNLNLPANGTAEAILLIGTCRISEAESYPEKARNNWRKSIAANEQRVLDYTFNGEPFHSDDTDLMKTVYWSKAMIASNKHYLKGEFPPMPCPAEYNFFFTHDLLQTSMGVVNFDPGYVKDGFRYLISLTGTDNILPHAYYWKDGKYVTEFCNAGNWNHLWFIITASLYLKHSGDLQTIQSLFPILDKSLDMMLENLGPDSLMNAGRPDWWDIGDVYGAKAFISILMVRALKDYSFLSDMVGNGKRDLKQLRFLAQRIKENTAEKLWDPEAKYLMNYMDGNEKDKHYYCGSLLAVNYDILDAEKQKMILHTAEKVLLDEELGIRNAMPPDFHLLTERYRFHGDEAGSPYFYFNGGVWPQGTAWYAMALLAAEQPDKALQVLRKYLTVTGINKSPNGQPTFYEYRFADPESKNYGAIDKPTFLWAGGFYLRVLYKVAGIRENDACLWFEPNLPKGLENLSYDLAIKGKPVRVRWLGSGRFIRQMEIDHRRSYSAVVIDSCEEIIIERGIPEMPYLAYSDAPVSGVGYDDVKKMMTIDFFKTSQIKIKFRIISPFKQIEGVEPGQILKKNIYSVFGNKVYEFVGELSGDIKKQKFTFKNQ